MTKVEHTANTSQKILILGAYGLIGYAISKRLISDGHKVAGLGRDLKAAYRVLPDIPWVQRDVGALTKESDWQDIIQDHTLVVNCSGALQDGPDDNLEAVHHYAVAALAKACTTHNTALIQISAVGAIQTASNTFLSTKAHGDAAIKASGVNYHILRPGMIIGANAFGGSTMLRMLAAFPLIQPIAKPKAMIQIAALDDIVNVVAAAVVGKIPSGFESDLVAPTANKLQDVVAQTRRWLGFAPAKIQLTIPTVFTSIISKGADQLARLGWRSPLRSSAMKTLDDGVLGTPTDLSKFGLPPMSSLQDTFTNMPVGAQDRLFARMALMMPVIIATLSLFWLLSGIIGIARAQDAAAVLMDVGWTKAMSLTSVLFWSVVDIMIGMAFMVRKLAPLACWVAIAVSLTYLVASTLTVPALWLDPLGPLVKILPSLVLAGIARLTLEAR